MKEKAGKARMLARWALLAALLLAAAALWRTEGTKTPVKEPLPSPAPTVSSTEREKRETAYQQDVSALRRLLESETADAATQEMAAQKLALLISEHQSELGLEDALQQAGFDSAVVIVQNGAVTVMIPQEKMSEASSAQILTLCIAHTDAGAENIRIMALR